MENNTKRGEQSRGSHREKFGKITARSKQDFLDEIMAIEGCGIDRAKQILKTCHANGIVRYDKPTNTWRGFLADPPPLAETVKAAPTSKQQEYRKKYGCMPWLSEHDFRNPAQSEPLKWIVARERELGEIIDIAEAGKRYRRAWSCSKDKSKLPFVRDPKIKRVRGADYREATVFRQMPRMHQDSDDMEAWLIQNINKDISEVFPQLWGAFSCGDVVPLSGNDDDGYEFVGADRVSEQADDEDISRNAEYDHEADDADECDDDSDDQEDEDSDEDEGLKAAYTEAARDSEEKVRQQAERQKRARAANVERILVGLKLAGR